MKSIIAVYIVAIAIDVAYSYSAYGSTKRHSNINAPKVPIYSQVSPQYYDSRASPNYIQYQPHYLNVPYIQKPQQQSPLVDDYNYRPNPNFYYYPQDRTEYQEPLYGIPTYHGDYNPKPYYFAQPSYMSQDDRLETTNPLDYLHEEILQENERERNNAAFMQNLAVYNKQIDSLKGRQQQLQQIQEMYNLKNNNEFDDYDIDQTNDWYDQTSILVDPSFDSYGPSQQQQQQQQPQFAAQYMPQMDIDYNDEVVNELKNLKQNRKGKSFNGYEKPVQQPAYVNHDWQQDMPLQDTDEEEEELINPDDSYDDDWINWGGQKRSIKPKKLDNELPQETKNSKQLNLPKIVDKSAKTIAITTTSTTKPLTVTSTEASKLLTKLHKGQKEVFLPRPATPVRRPFSESIMKSLENNKENENAPLPIYKTIKQIIDMEQNLSHLSNNQLPTSKIRKRFVTNEETLAQQLNGLKRTSK